ncbi:caspase family protein [Streptomyces sp. NRRL S-646]|uniref:caspase family protein n=1 Tax=Streptomyces sp. NRRL S-646 TaxID=1463917 RepID=UPI00068BE70F|nr:caspase family protein [Streptomyces sp. NRRL S-646]
MARHRALLIGAGRHEMPGISPLPFIPGDLDRLGKALKARGFDDVRVLAGLEGRRQVSRNFVMGRVNDFLGDAEPDDTLLILLSGHGVHAGGRDYLVPEDIDEGTHPFVSGCVPIDWSEHLEATSAGHVVFLIDACREGIEQDSMGVAAVRQWSRQKVSDALRRKVAYVYACSPGQYALFVRPQDSTVDRAAGVRAGESFSIFSRSVSDVVATHPAAAALDLGQFQNAVQERMKELHRAYRKKGEPQTLRVVTDIRYDEFSFLPPPRRRVRTRPARDSDSGTSAVRADADTTTAGSTAMAVGAGGGTSRPTQPPRGIRRGRQLLSALALLGLLGVAAWAADTYLHTGADNGTDRLPGKASNKADSGTNSPKSRGGSPSAEANAAAVSALHDCTPRSVEWTLRSLHNAYGPADTPTLLLSAKNFSDTDCKVDPGPKSAVLTITQAGGDDEYWSSGDCPKASGSAPDRVPAHRVVTYTVKWNREPSAPQCARPATPPAGAGTYLAELTVRRGFGTAETSFVLDK